MDEERRISLNRSLWDGVIKVHVSKYGILFLSLHPSCGTLRLEFTDILQYFNVPLRLLLPFLVVICWPGSLYPLENLLIIFRDTLQLSFPSFFAQGMRIFDTVVCTIDTAFELR